MRRLLAIMLIVLLLFTATACGKKENKTTEHISSEISSEEEDFHSPLLWRATDNQGRVIWFFGTIHIGDKRSKKVLERLQPVLKQCDALAVEFDIVAYEKNLTAQTKDLAVFAYTDGTTIQDHIPQPLYDKLVALLTETKLYNKVYNQFKPSFWYQLISQAIIKKTNLSASKAMDTLLIKDAYSAKRQVLEVESATLQYNMLAETPDDYYLLALDQETDAAELSAKQIEKLYDTWFDGDEKKISEMLEEDIATEELSEEEQKLVADFYEVTVAQRNIGMAEKAKDYLRSGKTVFFAVGTMHFLGEDGIVSLLQKEGFTFERVEI